MVGDKQTPTPTPTKISENFTNQKKSSRFNRKNVRNVGDSKRRRFK